MVEESYQRWDGAPEAPADGPSSSAQSLSVDDFEMLAVLGRGAYGRVLQVRKRDTGELFAMKVMRKADVIKRNQVRHALTERQLLQTVRHPFVVSLHFAFHSETHLYLVLALQSGGELFFHLKRDGAFAEPRVRLYAAEILLALEALHAVSRHARARAQKRRMRARLSNFAFGKSMLPHHERSMIIFFWSSPTDMYLAGIRAREPA